jgi:hypothetical protein
MISLKDCGNKRFLVYRGRGCVAFCRIGVVGDGEAGDLRETGTQAPLSVVG